MKAEAIDDYTAAWSAPRIFSALTNRGSPPRAQAVLRVADFDAHWRWPKDRGDPCGPGTALEALGRHDEADPNFARPSAGSRRVLALSASASSGLTASPWPIGCAAATAAFDEVSATTRANPKPSTGRAMLAMRSGQLDSALEYFNRTLDSDPRFTQARRSPRGPGPGSRITSVQPRHRLCLEA